MVQDCRRWIERIGTDSCDFIYLNPSLLTLSFAMFLKIGTVQIRFTIFRSESFEMLLGKLGG